MTTKSGMMAKRKRRTKPKTKFQLQLKDLGFKTYAAYLKSDHWQEFREAYFAKHKKICYCCQKSARDLHHIDYSHLGKERQKDVEPLCRTCHDKVHTIIRENHVPLNQAHEVVMFIMNG